MEIALLETDLSINKCLNMPTIYDIKKEMSAKVILKSIQEIVLNSARTFKYSENMDFSQAAILASDLLNYFRNESLEDIVLMFRMIRQGELGSGKGRLDHDVIFNIFVPAYLEKKAETREKQIRNEKAKYNQPIGEMSDYAKQKFEELSNMLSVKRINQPIKPVVNHHQVWINSLKINVKNLSLEELYLELDKVKKSDQSIFAEAVKIYQEEIDSRK